MKTISDHGFNRHSIENIYSSYDDPVNLLSNERRRRHSFSPDYSPELGLDDGTECNLTDRNALKQSWYKTIRTRYLMAGKGGMKKDIQFPKSLDNYRTSYYTDIKNAIIRSGSKIWDEADKRTRFTLRRKKTVRFDGGGDESESFDSGWMTLDNVERWDSLRQGSQDSGTKDSGIETSSNFTSSEDSNRDFKVHKKKYRRAK